MTLIIAIDGDKGSTLLGDSYFGDSDTGLKLGSDKPKISKRFLSNKKEIGFGFCGSVKIENILQYELELPKMSKYETCEEYVVSTLRKHLTELFKEGGCVLDDGKLISNSSLLICLGGKTYNFDSDMSIVISNKNYRCIGGGADFATGIMQFYYDNRETGIWKTALTTEQKLMNVGESVANCCSLVEAPFHTLFIKA